MDNEGDFDLCFPTAILLPTGPVNPVFRGYCYLTGSVGSPFLFFPHLLIVAPCARRIWMPLRELRSHRLSFSDSSNLKSRTNKHTANLLGTGLCAYFLKPYIKSTGLFLLHPTSLGELGTCPLR